MKKSGISTKLGASRSSKSRKTSDRAEEKNISILKKKKIIVDLLYNA